MFSNVEVLKFNPDSTIYLECNTYDLCNSSILLYSRSSNIIIIIVEEEEFKDKQYESEAKFIIKANKIHYVFAQSPLRVSTETTLE